MSWSIRQVASVLVVLVPLGLGREACAQSQTENLGQIGTSTGYTTPSLSGWTIAFAPLNSGSCASLVENPGTFANTAASNCSGVEVVETVYHNRLYLTYEGTGGSTLETAVGSSATACSGAPCANNYSDLSLGFTVTAPTGVTVSTASLSLTGTATLSGGGADLLTGDLGNISGGGTDNTKSLVTSLASNPNLVSAAFSSAVNSFSVTKDLKVNGNGATPGATLALNTVTQIYSPAAPEPISITLLAVGLVGLGAARRFRRRP